MKFNDANVVITGGASGIGRIMGRMALERGAARLIIWDINESNIELVKNELSGDPVGAQQPGSDTEQERRSEEKELPEGTFRRTAEGRDQGERQKQQQAEALGADQRHRPQGTAGRQGRPGSLSGITALLLPADQQPYESRTDQRCRNISEKVFGR